jgi:hypothetical protein
LPIFNFNKRKRKGKKKAEKPTLTILPFPFGDLFYHLGYCLFLVLTEKERMGREEEGNERRGKGENFSIFVHS